MAGKSQEARQAKRDELVRGVAGMAARCRVPLDHLLDEHDAPTQVMRWLESALDLSILDHPTMFSDVKRSEYQILAAFVYELKWVDHDGRLGGLAASASKHYRRARVPGEALRVTEMALPECLPADVRGRAALLTTRAAAYKDLRQFEEAEDTVRQAMKLAPDHPYPWLVLGSVYRLTQRPDEAVSAFEQAGILGISRQVLRRAWHDPMDFDLIEGWSK